MPVDPPSCTSGASITRSHGTPSSRCQPWRLIGFSLRRPITCLPGTPATNRAPDADASGAKAETVHVWLAAAGRLGRSHPPVGQAADGRQGGESRRGLPCSETETTPAVSWRRSLPTRPSTGRWCLRFRGGCSGGGARGLGARRATGGVGGAEDRCAPGQPELGIGAIAEGRDEAVVTRTAGRLGLGSVQMRTLAEEERVESSGRHSVTARSASSTTRTGSDAATTFPASSVVGTTR